MTHLAVGPGGWDRWARAATTVPCPFRRCSTACRGRRLIGGDHRIAAANRAYREQYASGADVVGLAATRCRTGTPPPATRRGRRAPSRGRARAGNRAGRSTCTSRPGGAARGGGHAPDPGRVGGGRLVPRDDPAVAGAAARASGEGFVGRSPAFNRMLELATRVAPTEVPVLLLGESGTGKERLAQVVHEVSARAAGRFVPLDCSGVTESLFESELFGHEKGAFTGASQRKVGLVETCDGGTLFLDEVGDIPLPLQVKLLRLIETRTFRRVGSTEPRKSDFRLVCATHRDLGRMVDERDLPPGPLPPSERLPDPAARSPRAAGGRASPHRERPAPPRRRGPVPLPPRHASRPRGVRVPGKRARAAEPGGAGLPPRRGRGGAPRAPARRGPGRRLGGAGAAEARDLVS